MLKIFLFILGFLLSLKAYSQNEQKDTIKVLNVVTIKAPLLDAELIRSPYSIGIIDARALANTAPFSLLPAVNSIPGVRMEERSPGSYRFSIRGSLLRSPFGVRNIKIYADDFSLTDAGGNTYLNLLDPAAANSIDIFKGPVSSIYGASTGGAVAFKLPQANQDMLRISTTAGSFGGFIEQTALDRSKGDLSIGIRQSYQQSNGYREQSALKKHYIQVTPAWEYAPGNSLK
ncbi:MAG: Plug domain-containing protein, partial [Sphingobacteriales bacterium]